MLLSLVMTVAGCESEPREPPTGSGESAQMPGSSATPEVTQATGEPVSWTLTSEGIIAVQAVDGRGSATPLMFGNTQDNVIGALSIPLGKPAESDNVECGAGPMHFADFGPIQVNFQNGKFVGWLAKGGPGFETTDDIAPGGRFADMAEGHGAEPIADSTLDGEFEMRSDDGGTIGGFRDPQDRIISLHAGANCFFR